MKLSRAVQGVSDQSQPLLPSYRAQSSSVPCGKLQNETDTSSPLPVHLHNVRSFWSLTAPIQYWLDVSLLYGRSNKISYYFSDLILIIYLIVLFNLLFSMKNDIFSNILLLISKNFLILYLYTRILWQFFL